jgi:xanthine dehydrogenase accessory factor
MIEGDLAVRVEQLLGERTPFVMATVVRARHPTSVRPGDAAVVLGDGTIDGFVGGVCAESSVRLHALRAMETGEPLLLRLVPDGDDATDDPSEGAVVERNPCLSGGALEIFLEPHLPPARLVVLGNSPIAVAVETLARASGYDCTRVPAGAGVSVAGAAAVVVASHGSAKEEVLAEALRAGVPYVALVASRKRGAAVREGLDVAPELAAQLQTPAGLDIGARTPGEVAVSILAEIVATRPRPPARPAKATAPAVAGIDPVCGMTVIAGADALHTEHQDRQVWFCGRGCLQAFRADPAAYRP